MYLEYNGLFHSLDVLCCEAGMPRQALDRAFVQSQLRCTAACVDVSFLFFQFLFFLFNNNCNDLIPQHQSGRARNEDAPPVRLHPNAQRLVSLPRVFHAHFCRQVHVGSASIGAPTSTSSRFDFARSSRRGVRPQQRAHIFQVEVNPYLICLFDPPLLRFYWRRLRFQRWTCKWCRRIGLWVHCWTTRLQRWDELDAETDAQIHLFQQALPTGQC